MRSITTKLSPLGHAAVKYARQGWRVFPLHPKGKTPLVKNGFHAATNNVKQVRLLARTSRANIGIACSERGPYRASTWDKGQAATDSSDA